MIKFEYFKKDHYSEICVRIWLEALTGKQTLLFHHIGTYLEEHGHEVIFTTRKSDYTESNLSRLGRSFHSIGKFGGATLKGKLVAGSKRIIELAELIDNQQPDLLISFPSPDATRVAFGLGIPIIQLNDTPHAVAVAKLTISLSDTLVYPSAIDEDEFNRFGVTNFIEYEGVDEILWIKDFEPKSKLLDDLGLEPYQYLVLRCEESKAAYFQKLYPNFTPGDTIVRDIIPRLKEEGYDVPIVAFPRYPEQEEILDDLGVIVPNYSVDTLSLLHYARVMMTGGGTMGREAALLGTPTLYTFPLELKVNTFIANRGFPIIHDPNHLNAPKKIIDLMDMQRMEENKRKEMVDSIESPTLGINRAMKYIFGDDLTD